MESPRYRIAIREDGEISSIADKQTGLELLDPKAPFPFNQYVYEGYAKIAQAGWHDSKYKGKGTGKVVPRTTDWYVESGPVCDRLVVEGTLEIPDFPVQVGEVEKVVRTVTLWKQLDRIDCEVRLIGKKESAMIEAGHVAFPLAIPDFRFRMELLGAVTDPVADVLVKGNRDTFAVQRWVDVSGPKGGVTWATVEAPLVSVGDIRIFSWDANYVPSRASHLLQRAEQRLVDELPGIPGRRLHVPLRSAGSRGHGAGRAVRLGDDEPAPGTRCETGRASVRATSACGRLLRGFACQRDPRQCQTRRGRAWIGDPPV